MQAGSPAFQKIGAMAFVDLGDVDAVWQDLKPALPSDLVDFVDYYERTWIGTPGTPPIFSPWMWNHHESVLAPEQQYRGGVAQWVFLYRQPTQPYHLALP